MLTTETVRHVRCIFSAVLLGCTFTLAHAQTAPSKIMTLIVPYPAGGASDVVARQMQVPLQKAFGEPLLVENVSGAGGSIAVQKLLTAPADGRSMLLGSPIDLIQTPLALAAVKHKPEDLRLVGLVARANMLLIVRQGVKANTVDELIAQARTSPNEPLSYGSVGAGSIYHLVAEKFSQQTGVKMTHVPYKGAAPLLQDLMGGQIDIAFVPLAGGVIGMIESGRVKPLGLAAEKRHPLFPNVPTMAEGKSIKDFSYDSWVGIATPKGVQDGIATKLNTAIVDVLKNPALRKEIESSGMRAADPMDLQALDKLYAAETSRYREIARSINLQPQ